jgi:hypothetical protein
VRGMHVPLESLFAIITGVVILIVPKFLNYIVAFYLIAVGVLGAIR